MFVLCEEYKYQLISASVLSWAQPGLSTGLCVCN